MDSIVFKLAFIGFIGIFVQWLAWRFRIPAIVMLLLAGLIAGPITGYLNPVDDLGQIYKPLIALAVAIILFEGGLTLKWSEIHETSTALRRIIMIGGPLIWVGSALSAHYVGGLEWPTSIILGAILVVTGPTVIMPLLRSAKLSPRPGSLLRWEAIVNDPIGAMFAVLSFEFYLIFFAHFPEGATHGANGFIIRAIAAFLFAIFGGYMISKSLVWAFIRGFVPEYLKAPIMVITVLATFAVSDLMLEESGLLTVTIMGIVIANSRIASLNEMRRFKETITVLLVSGVFILLTAALKMETLVSLDWRAVGFVIMVLFIIRPVAILIATTGAGISIQERFLVGWIAPRGIVAVAVSGLFGATLVETGVADGEKMIAYTFAVVAATIFLHGFSLPYLARLLNLQSTQRQGILFVGGSSWVNALAKKLMEHDIPVLIADRNWSHIQESRMAGLPVFYGEVLSEAAHHNIDFNEYSHLIAASDNEYYNSLICTDFGPEIGRANVFEINKTRETSERQQLNFTLGGRPLTASGQTLSQLNLKILGGWHFRATKLTEEFTFEKLLDTLEEKAIIILAARAERGFDFIGPKITDKPKQGSIVITFAPKVSV